MRGPQHNRTARAQELRTNATSAEDKLWRELRSRRLGGFKFVRQVPVGPYFADFVCRTHRVIVEIDGGTHSEPHEIAADRRRTKDLERLGYRVYLAWNGDVYDNIDGVLEKLLALLEGRLGWGEDRSG